MVLTLFASWLLVRTKIRGRWLLDLLTTLPLLFPGIVMGLGDSSLLSVCADSRVRHAVDSIDRFRHALHPLRDSLYAFGLAAVAQGTRRGLLRLRRVVVATPCGVSSLPLITPSFLGGWVFIFLLSAKELSMSVLLVSPQTPVVSVAIFELWENAQVGELAAFGVIWSAILVSVAIVYYFIARRYGVQQS